MASLNCESMDVEMFSSVPAVLLEKCAALSVQPDAAQRLVQAMQGVYPTHTHTHPRALLAHTETARIKTLINIERTVCVKC